MQYYCPILPHKHRCGRVRLQKTSRLRELRDEASLSQMELAQRSGVSRATIADLEAGKRPARPSTRRKLAEALGVEPKELMK